MDVSDDCDVAEQCCGLNDFLGLALVVLEWAAVDEAARLGAKDGKFSYDPQDFRSLEIC